MDATLQQVDRSVWWGWGDPAEARPLPAGARRMLADRLGAGDGPLRPPVDLEDVELPACRLGQDARDALTAAVGADHVSALRLHRVERAGGKSYVDLVRARTGRLPYAPDAVVFPADHDEVAAVVRAAGAHGFALVPYGGGTSVVGGLTVEAGERPVVSLDLRRLTGLVALDEVDLTATFRAGTMAPSAEAALHERGFTLGHFPQSYQQASLGGFVATRSAGQSSSGYGRIDDLVDGVRAATPAGDLELGSRSPASAAGPRLHDLLVGSEGAYGVITEVTLRIRPARKVVHHLAVTFADFGAGADALRQLVQRLGHDGQPDVTRLSDESETEVSLALAGRSGAALSRYLRVRGLSTPCLAILVWDDQDDDAARDRMKRARRILRSAGAVALPAKVARGWEHGRFGAPYLRDELLGRRVFVETLETATHWSNLLSLKQEVGDAIEQAMADCGTPAIAQCHVSHVYASGASLYFTCLAREADDPHAQWRAMKTAASEAIVAAGGTITHHHAVGRDHRPYLAAEIGETGVRILRAVKNELDPQNVMNPGVLIPSPSESSA